MPRDHGGGLDAAVAAFGGAKNDWLDLSTGINPVPYPVGRIPDHAWTALPDSAAMERLLRDARSFWNVPDDARIVAAPGASALIARVPGLVAPGPVRIPAPTYNEHAAAFLAHGHRVVSQEPASVQVLVHPNNPDGRLWPGEVLNEQNLTVIDESFCDVMPGASHVSRAADDGVLILKSFGKFWGLAGLRLGFAIGAPALADRLQELLGPWPVSGAALEIGARALADVTWAEATRTRLGAESVRLDRTMASHGARAVGGTTLFRLYEVDDARAWQDRLAKGHVWSRIFPYSTTWLRLGLPAPDRWQQLERAL
jgi:cobalamin biosynthetic protein CobC